jgi:hypothetical protein
MINFNEIKKFNQMINKIYETDKQYDTYFLFNLLVIYL